VSQQYDMPSCNGASIIIIKPKSKDGFSRSLHITTYIHFKVHLIHVTNFSKPYHQTKFQNPTFHLRISHQYRFGTIDGRRLKVAK